MRVLRDRRQDCVCAAVPSCHPTTTQHSLEDVGKLWVDWWIHGLILVSFGIQVFLFLAAGLRRRSVSRVLRSLLWLAYLSADFVAVFVLGHLSVHSSGPSHQLLFLWAPLVLFHLGGQYTMTALSMKDNELWTRHLLGLVTQVVVAGYVVSRSSWQDRRLLAAMVSMFLSGCWRYAERTLCLYRASPAKLKEYAMRSLSNYVQTANTKREESEPRHREHWCGLCAIILRALGLKLWRQDIWSARLKMMQKADGRRSSSHSAKVISSRVATLVSETPLSDITDLDASPSFIQSQLQQFKSNEHRCRAYDYVGTQLVHVYQHLYTKAPQPLHSILRHWLISWDCLSGGSPCIIMLLLFSLLAFPLIVLFPLLSTSTTLVLLSKVAEKSQLYSQVDVIVSRILPIGAITLEVASLFITYAPDSIHPAWGWGTKQCSEMLGQYNMIKSLTRKDASVIMSFVPQWISNHLDDKTITHIPVYQDLKMFVLDKMLGYGTRKEDWNFARFRGQLALGKLLHARSETALHKSINDVDFPTSVLIWHIATDILYFQDDNTNTTNSSQQQQQQMKKKMSRELSNYMMYLIFKCGVMLTNSTEILHNNALKVMEANLSLGEKDAMGKVFHNYKIDRHTTSSNALLDELQPQLADKIRRWKAIVGACEVAQELIDIHGEVTSWDLISEVWLEMLYYIAPRCGKDFHSEHLTTGGEFITHVLVLMQCVGPFLTPSCL